MVAANEWNPDLDEKDEESAGPVIFGVSLNDPKVIGIALGVLGALLSGYLVYSQILPTVEQNNKLKADIETTTQEVAEKEKQIKERAKAEEDLAIAKQKRADVAALFASEQTMETLLYDVNRLIDQLNTGITDETQQAIMLKFEPVEPAQPGNYIVADGSLGPLVNGKLKRRNFKVEFEGSYQQVRDFLL
jgi:type IV pilus assembly protein PilO